jgi:dipeptidyl aminopeptidase/acylaminoacyl peptidase
MPLSVGAAACCPACRFGKRHLHLGDKQWGVGTMQHDLTDSVNWAVQAGVAAAGKVAIFGGSYGGYACLAGAGPASTALTW